MHNPKKKIFFILAILVVIIFVVFAFRGNEEQLTQPQKNENYESLAFDNSRIDLEVVNTESSRRQGLSGRENLPENAAMFFVFDEPGLYGIWMKEMLFDIDIVWLDEDFRVVHVVDGATPESYPTIFRSSALSHFVLEAGAGFVDKYEIKQGDLLEIQSI